MKAILAIARAEVLKSWKVVAVPLLAVIVVFALAAIGTRSSERSILGNLMSALIVLGFPLAAVPAAVIGLNLFAPDVRQRRVSFFLTRPCSPWQLWVGRLLGAAAVVGVGGLGVVLVQPFAGFGPQGGRENTVIAALIFGAVLLGVLLAMNALAMVLAANSARWFIADALAGLVLVAATAWSLGKVLHFADQRLVVDGVYAILLAAVASLFLAGFAFLAAGHGDGPAGHRAHSLTLWTCAVLTLAGLAAHRAIEWRRPLGSSILSHPSALAVGPDKALIRIWGRSTASYLLDTRTGEARRVPGFASSAAVSAGSSGLVGFVEERLDLHARDGFLGQYLVVSSLEPGQTPVADLPLRGRFRRLIDISPQGDLALFETWNSLAMIRTQTGGTVFDQPTSSLKWAAFQGDSGIVVLDSDGTFARMRRLSPEGKVIDTRTFPVKGSNWVLSIHEPSGRVAVTEPEQGVALYDRDGQLLVSLSAQAPPDAGLRSAGRPIMSPSSVFFTRAGDLLAATPSGLKIVAHDEVAIRDVTLAAGTLATSWGRSHILAELETGELAVWRNSVAESEIVLVNPKTGEIRLEFKGVSPVGFRFGHQLVDDASPGSGPVRRLFENEAGDILCLDPGGSSLRLLVKNTSGDR